MRLRVSLSNSAWCRPAPTPSVHPFSDRQTVSAEGGKDPVGIETSCLLPALLLHHKSFPPWSNPSLLPDPPPSTSTRIVYVRRPVLFLPFFSSRHTIHPTELRRKSSFPHRDVLLVNHNSVARRDALALTGTTHGVLYRGVDGSAWRAGDRFPSGRLSRARLLSLWVEHNLTRLKREQFERRLREEGRRGEKILRVCFEKNRKRVELTRELIKKRLPFFRGFCWCWIF